MDTIEQGQRRNYMVVKSNELIQQSRVTFSLQEQKALLYIISQLKPGTKKFTYQTLDLSEFCQISGMKICGKNYSDLKSAIDGLGRPFWIWMDNDSEEQCRFVQKAVVHPRKGTIQLRLDESLQPYLLELKKNYTQYELKYILTMQSKYTIRLYELLRSWAERGYCEYDLDKLQKLLGSEYRWQDFKRFALEPAVDEINEITDLQVEYAVHKAGRKVSFITFDIKKKGKKKSINAAVARSKRFVKAKADKEGL